MSTFTVTSDTGVTATVIPAAPATFTVASATPSTFTLDGALKGPKGDTGAQGPAGATGTQGPTGPAGATGASGSTGATGATGAAGSNGTNGTNGIDGKTVLNGTTTPSSGTGNNGDFYINTATNTIYGPKTGGAWGSGTSLIGPAGATGSTGATGATGSAGANGTNGSVWYSGSGAPSAGTGANGDYYLNTANGDVYTKVSGSWGSPIENLTGPTGPGGASSAVTRSITQTSHGFTVGQLVYFNGTTYVTADNTASSTAEVDGMVSSVTSTSVFVLTMRGYITGLSGLTAGTTYFLGTSGALTATAPSTTGYIRKPLFHADTTTSGYFNNYLGIANAAASTANVTKASNATATNIIQLSGGTDKSIADYTPTGVGIVKVSSAGVPSIAASSTDYAPPTTGSGVLKGNGSGGFNTATAGTDYYNPGGTDVSIADGGTGVSSLPTGLLIGSGTSAITATTAPTGVIVGTTDTQTLTNKRVTPRINSTTSSATPAINTDTTDQFNITALAATVTSMTTSLTGTPTDGQKLMIRIKDNGSAQTITWGSSFQSSGVATLLPTTVASKTHMSGFVYDSVATKWTLMAVDAMGY